ELVRARAVHGRGAAVRARRRLSRGVPADPRQGRDPAADRHRPLEGRPRDAVRAERADPDRDRAPARRLGHGADAAALPPGLVPGAKPGSFTLRAARALTRRTFLATLA